MSRTKIALFGGAFNPVTIAHNNVAVMVHLETGMPIWMMPCWDHRFGKHMAAAYDRLDMLSLSVTAGQQDWKYVFDFEVANKLDGSTYETMERLKAKFPQFEFHIVIGMDNANAIMKWDRGEQLIKEHPFIVCGRGGFEEKLHWFHEAPHRFIECNESMASTDVREAIHSGDYHKASTMVCPTVFEYIKRNNLYTGV